MPFQSLGLDPALVRAVRTLGYAEPTPVQVGAIPPGIAGRDVLATAQTGTGKTAAFLLPLLHRLVPEPRGTTRALVVSPTRELAEQIEAMCRALSQHSAMRSTLIVGGQPQGPQVRALKAGPDVVVATPGRLLDLITQGVAAFDRVTALVLDEADSMLDMGFLPEVRRIVARLPARRQTLMFSATMPPVIAKLAGDLLRKPEVVQIGRRTAAAIGITQAAYPVPHHLKTALVRYLLRNTEMPSVLVFTRTKSDARRVAKAVAADGFSVAELHSNRTPAQRTKAMAAFRRGAVQVMVATNIAARGLDVDHITHVISTDVPDVPEDYVHRVGRTGRAGAEGDAFVLVSPTEEGSLSRIERQIGLRLPRVTLPDFDYRAAPQRPPAAARPPARAAAPHRAAAKPPKPGGRGKPPAKPPGAGGRPGQRRRP